MILIYINFFSYAHTFSSKIVDLLSFASNFFLFCEPKKVFESTQRSTRDWREKGIARELETLLNKAVTVELAAHHAPLISTKHKSVAQT